MPPPTITSTDLILNPDGSIYHLSLEPEHVSDYIIAVGDPGRVHKVTQYFDNLPHKARLKRLDKYNKTRSMSGFQLNRSGGI